MTVTYRQPRRSETAKSRSTLVAAVGALTLALSLTFWMLGSAALAAVLGQNDNVGICHANNGVKGFNAIAPNVDSIVKKSGHDSHDDDIIPAFDYDLGKGAGVQHYPGKNLALLSTLNNGCVTPLVGPAAAQQVSPGALGTTASTCQGNPSAPTAPGYTVPTTTGITYSPAAGGPAAPGSTVSVTATANPGYVINVGGVLSNSVVLQVQIPALATGCSSNVVINPAPAGGSAGASAGSANIDNLGVTKTGTGVAEPGDELVWTITVANVAGTPATGFTVSDALTDGLSFSLAEGPGFSCSAVLQVITCTYSGSLAAGQSAAITVRALLDAAFQGTSVSNTAVVDPGRPDTNAADNSSTAVTDVTQPEPEAPEEFTGGGGGATVAPPAGEGSGTALPFTGSNVAQLLGGGLALLMLGVYMVVVGYRRTEQPE